MIYETCITKADGKRIRQNLLQNVICDAFAENKTIFTTSNDAIAVTSG